MATATTRRNIVKALVLHLVSSSLIFFSAGDTDAATSAPDVAWTGAETFSPVTVGPNLARCGAFPRNIEARFSGLGVDTRGGAYHVLVSGCLDTEADVVFDLEARDTYIRTGEALLIAPDDARLVVDPTTCVATNPSPARFGVAGGTGRFAGATGGGHYTLVMTMPDCIGPQVPVHVWFDGRLELVT